jgi:hypothetical protein
MIQNIPTLILAVSCSATQVINQTVTWNDMDKKTLISAQERCAVHFPEAPCLRTLTKVEENGYRAICGAKERENDLESLQYEDKSKSTDKNE